MTDLNRREFIHRSVRTGLASASVLGVGWWLHDRDPPALEPSTKALSGIPDFSKPRDKDPAMAIAKGTDRIEMVRRTLGALGGMNRFVQPGDRVVIKVNAAFASPPAISATSHPDLVEALVLACREAGAADDPERPQVELARLLPGAGRAARQGEHRPPAGEVPTG